jgi:hypothetical protein
VKLRLQTVLLHTILNYVKGENEYSASSFLYTILANSVASELQMFSAIIVKVCYIVSQQLRHVMSESV